MKPALVTIALILTTPGAPASQVQLCEQWVPAVAVGQLPFQLRESSGIAASRDYPGRLYPHQRLGRRGQVLHLERRRRRRADRVDRRLQTARHRSTQPGTVCRSGIVPLHRRYRRQRAVALHDRSRRRERSGALRLDGQRGRASHASLSRWPAQRGEHGGSSRRHALHPDQGTAGAPLPRQGRSNDANAGSRHDREHGHPADRHGDR